MKMSKIFTTIFQPLKFFQQGVHGMLQPQTGAFRSLVKSESFLVNTVRTKVRCYFPRPNEVRRIRRHGWEKRISTVNGRKVIMRRLLKGRFVLTH